MRFDPISRLKADEAVNLLTAVKESMLQDEGLADIYNKMIHESRKQSIKSTDKELYLVQQTPRTPTQLTSFSNNSFDSWPSLPSIRKNSSTSVLSRSTAFTTATRCNETVFTNTANGELDFDRRVARLDSDAASRITEISMIHDSPERSQEGSPAPLNSPDPMEIIADHAATERTPFNWENNDALNPTYVGLSSNQPSAIQRAALRAYDFTSSNYSRLADVSASAAGRVRSSFGSLRDRVQVPNIRIPGSSSIEHQFYSNLRMVFILNRLNHDCGGVAFVQNNFLRTLWCIQKTLL